MRNKTSINYYYSLKSLLPPKKFSGIKKKIAKDSNERLEALWSIIIAGYPVDFALSNYKQLHAYLQDKPIDYSEALTTYSIYPGLNIGIYITKTKWYELN
ncbi:MAG TPA: hypothetical protein VKA38_06415 [Draconibacterium sp.]|nr:hypothetical protein [Draconibacterium sp.]